MSVEMGRLLLARYTYIWVTLAALMYARFWWLWSSEGPASSRANFSIRGATTRRRRGRYLAEGPDGLEAHPDRYLSRTMDSYVEGNDPDLAEGPASDDELCRTGLADIASDGWDPESGAPSEGSDVPTHDQRMIDRRTEIKLWLDRPWNRLRKRGEGENDG